MYICIYVYMYIHKYIYIWVSCNILDQKVLEKSGKKISSNIISWYIFMKIRLQGTYIRMRSANII